MNTKTKRPWRRKEEEEEENKQRNKVVLVAVRNPPPNSESEDEVPSVPVELFPGAKPRRLEDSSGEDQSSAQLARQCKSFKDMHWPEEGSDSWHLITKAERYERIQAMQRIREDAVSEDAMRKGFADSIPAFDGFIDGIPAFRGTEEGRPKDNVVVAIHTKKMFFGKQLEEAMTANPDMRFFDSFPDTRPGSTRDTRLYPDTFQKMKQQLECLHHIPSFVKHILEMHAGEARLVGDPWWTRLGPWQCHRKLCFWHYQFMPNTEARDYILHRNAGSRMSNDLDDAEIDQIMRLCHDETTVLRRTWNYDLRDWDWSLIQGKYITLAEWFWHGSTTLSCHDLYHTYISFPRFIYHRQASSKTPGAARAFRNNHRHNHHKATGVYGINSINGPWRPRGY